MFFSPKIIYEDDSILVAIKPPGMLVCSELNTEFVETKGTLLEYLNKNFNFNFAGVPNYGVVHRLDRNTSGVVIFAKSSQSFCFLSKLFKERRVCKIYYSYCSGSIKKRDFKLKTGHGRDARGFTYTSRFGKLQKKTSRVAISSFFVRNGNVKTSDVLIRLITGRTHQARVHLSDIGHFVINDCVYGDKKQAKHNKQHLLHALYIRIKHPLTKRHMSFISPCYFI